MRVDQSKSNAIQNSEVSPAKTARTGAATGAKKIEKTEKPGSAAAASSADSISADISAKGKEFAKAKEVAQNAPDIREEKIAELRRRISAGSYRPDADAIADRMVAEHLDMAGIG